MMIFYFYFVLDQINNSKKSNFMHGKPSIKSKEYYIDARMSTAKKNKKNRERSGRNNNTSTPISHSVSYNHHKY